MVQTQRLKRCAGRAHRSTAKTDSVAGQAGLQQIGVVSTDSLLPSTTTSLGSGLSIFGPGNGIFRAETGGRFWAQNSENGRNSVRRPPHASLTDLERFGKGATGGGAGQMLRGHGRASPKG